LKISATVTLKKDVLDPQGKVVNQTLKNMDYDNITNVRQGKFFEVELKENNYDKAKKIKKKFVKF
jgi:phosphoribosylformylglycinamidine synthase PurS subunit